MTMILRTKFLTFALLGLLALVPDRVAAQGSADARVGCSSQ